MSYKTQLSIFVNYVRHMPALCRYLYKSNSAGVQDYLCNRLYGLPEAGIERYLSQLCQLLISRNFASLERVLIALCAKSLRIAVKVRRLTPPMTLSVSAQSDQIACKHVMSSTAKVC